jgi:hypothetical protein
VRRVLLSLMVLLFVPSLAVADTPEKAMGELYILGITINQEKPLDSYNWCAEEVEKAFREQAKSFHRQIHSRLVQADKATHAGAMDGLAWVQKQTTKKDLVVIYVGAHGETHPTNGWGIATADGKTLWGREIKQELAKLPCPVIIMIETCTSGGFAQAHKNDIPVPANVTVLCACSGKQTIDNQLDMALMEGLYGRADFNRDGVIVLDELIRYIHLRYKEWWPDPDATESSGLPVLHKAKDMPGTLKLTQVAPNLSAVLHNGIWYSALPGKQEGDKFQVHLLGWSNKPGHYFLRDKATREQLCLPADGRPMLVEQDGRWYPALAVGEESDKIRVRYIGHNEEETVARSRIFLPFVGDPEKPNYPSKVANSRWGQVGPAGAWKDTIAGTMFKGSLYTVESDGVLYSTDLSKGTWKNIGKPEFAQTKFMFAADNHLYTIETNGSLYQVNPRKGTWKQVGEASAWKETIAGTVLKGRLFTVESDGGLYETDLASGEWKQIGQTEFATTVAMFAAGDSLYTIEKDGSLYRVDPENGTWARIGPQGAWEPTKVGAVCNGKLYTVSANGRLYVADLGKGEWKQIAKAEFGGTLGLFPAGDKVFLIEKAGSLSWLRAK